MKNDPCVSLEAVVKCGRETALRRQSVVYAEDGNVLISVRPQAGIVQLRARLAADEPAAMHVDNGSIDATVLVLTGCFLVSLDMVLGN